MSLKIFTLVAGLFFTGSVYASLGVNIDPARPVIVRSDLNPDPEGKLVVGPWFRAQYELRSSEDEPVAISRLRFKVTSSEGKVFTQSNDFAKPAEIRAGEALGMDVFLGGLPPSNSSTYKVEVTVSGWFGPNKTLGRPFDHTNVFETQ